MTKKITRGISKDFADEFMKSDLYKFYLKNKPELIIGVRNNYLNLYYNCDSIAKIKHTKGDIVCEIDKYYLDGKHYNSKDKEKHFVISQNKIIEQYLNIKKHSDAKTTSEKKILIISDLGEVVYTHLKKPILKDYEASSYHNGTYLNALPDFVSHYIFERFEDLMVQSFE